MLAVPDAARLCVGVLGTSAPHPLVHNSHSATKTDRLPVARRDNVVGRNRRNLCSALVARVSRLLSARL